MLRIIDKLVHIFYVLTLKNKQNFDHKHDLSIVIDKVILSIILIFFITYNLLSFFMARVIEMNLETNLKPFKLHIVLGALIFVFSSSYFLKKRYKLLYPEKLDITNFSEKQLKKFRLIIWCITGYIFIPLLLLIYYISI